MLNKITPRISAVLGAVRDRSYINKYAKGKIKEPPAFYNSLIKKSGPPAKAFNQKVKSWMLAYKDNIKYFDMVDKINKMFKG